MLRAMNKDQAYFSALRATSFSAMWPKTTSAERNPVGARTTQRAVLDRHFAGGGIFCARGRS